MDKIHALNGLDWAILVIIVTGIALGYTRGLISQLVSIAGLFIAYVVALNWYKDVAPLVGDVISLPTNSAYSQYEFIVKGLNLETYAANAIAFALLFFGTKLALLIVGRLLHLFASVPGIKTVNQLTGAALGLVEAAVLIIVAVNVMTIMPSENVQRLLKQSTISPYVINESPVIADKLHEVWKQHTAGDKGEKS